MRGATCDVRGAKRAKEQVRRGRGQCSARILPLATPPAVVPLTSLPEGATARLHDADLDVEARELLRGLGLTDRALVRVCKQGEPCVIQVHATRIGITGRVARAIRVEPVADGTVA